jgi:hypothetical protein
MEASEGVCFASAPAAAQVAGAAAGGFAGGVVGSNGSLKQGVIGGLTGAAFYGVGTASPYSSSSVSSSVGNVVGHALVGCASSAAGGGKCGSGALSAGISDFAGNNMPDSFQNNLALGTTYNAVVGGTVSSLTGGKFATGAETAAFGYLFNALMHVNGLPIRQGSGALPYFDDSISDRVVGFFQSLLSQGVPIQMTDGFRTDDMQSGLTGNQYGGAAVGSSLHEAGYAFDVNWNALTTDQRNTVLQTAQQFGFQWGGPWKISDPVHFQINPFSSITARRAYIPTAQQQYRSLTNGGGQ